MSKRLAVGPQPAVKIELVEGDLRLVGWDNDEILIRADDEEVTLQQDGENVSLTCRDDLAINVPKNSNVHVLAAKGDMSVRGLTGTFEADMIDGDVAMRDVGTVTLAAVESDFSLRGARGDVHVKSVGGDASLRDLSGSLTLDSVSDDLAIRGVGGNLKVDVESDVVVHLEPKPGQEYSVTAGDDILLILPSEANATLTINAEKINVDWPDVEPQNITSRLVELGDGSAQIKLDAGGDVLVTDRSDAAESADEFGNFAGMMFDWGSWGREIGQNWGDIGRDFGSEIGERMSRKAEEIAHRAERHAQEAARRAERKARKAVRRHGGKMKWTIDLDNLPKMPKREPVSDKERMTILRMLAEKKITSEEAEQLLSALEGGK